MTVTLNSGHAQVVLTEAVEGRRIGKGNNDDLRDLNRALIHEFASNGSTALAVMNVPVGITTFGASYSTLCRAKVRVWGDGTRLTFHVYGSYFSARLYFGGVLIGSVAVPGAAPAWVSLSSTALSGASFDADGMCTVLVECQNNTGDGTIYHVIVAEDKLQSANLPAAGNTQTNFLAMHDALYDSADHPVDNFAIQKLEDNADQLLFERSRRICQMFPTQGNANQIWRLSSCHWRLDGPYTFMTPGYNDDEGLTVTITVEVGSSPASLDLEIFALTEYEDFENTRLARLQTISSGSVQYLTFKGLKARAGEPCQVWVAFKSEVGSEIDTIDAYTWSAGTPQTLYCERNTTLEAAVSSPDLIPWGYCIVAEAEDIAAAKDATVKNAIGYSTASQTADIACVQGVDNSGGLAADLALLLTISPNSQTGITRSPDFGLVDKWWTTTPNDRVQDKSIGIHRCAIGYLYAVYVQAGGVVAPSRVKRARAGLPPSAGALEAVAQRCNAMVFGGNSQVLLRHSGNGNARSQLTSGGGQITDFAGMYLFTESAGTGGNSYQWTVPISEPNVSGGLASLTLRGRFILIASVGDGSALGDEEVLNYQCRFTSGDWVPGSIQHTRRATSGSQQEPTLVDALVAMTSTAVEVGSSPQETTANSYGQCYTWPGEHHFSRRVWAYGPTFTDVSQPSFPTTLIAEIQGLGGNRQPGRVTAQLIVAGLFVWWDSREA